MSNTSSEALRVPFRANHEHTRYRKLKKRETAPNVKDDSWL